MQNIGEEICGEYLKHIMKCEFVSYNVDLGNQGEMDVLGISLSDKKIYICESATHTQGLGYSKRDVKTNKIVPDDYNRFKSKFSKNAVYVRMQFPKFEIVPMLWSPIVKSSVKVGSYNTINELYRLKSDLLSENLDLNLIINDDYKQAIQALKDHAKTHSVEMKSSVMRIFQIEGYLDSHLKKRK